MTDILRLAVIKIGIFVVASFLCWSIGRRLVPFAWQKIVTRYSEPKGAETKLAPAVGGLEGILYVFAVMSQNYELITGWFVMKAFYGWISARRSRNAAPGHDSLALFNEYLIGNLLSVFVGITFGLGGRLVMQLVGVAA